MPHILIFQGSPLRYQDQIGQIPGGRTNTELFTDALDHGLGELRRDGKPADPLSTFTLNVADGERLPQGMALSDFDGVVITGSPLNAYNDEPAVRLQLDLAREIFHAGIPAFGSCWGLQIMCAALGGTVHLNPRGREFGVARNVCLTDVGRNHALFDGKDGAFDALCSHEDEVASLPPGTTLLASNRVSRVQAAEIRDGEKVFWGVQYHPEFDFPILAALMERRALRQINDGYARTRDDVVALCSDYRTLGSDAPPRDLLWRFGISDNIMDPRLRRREFRNWLDTLVLPYMSRRN